MLVKYLLSAVALGFVVAIPPGSVTVIACQRSLLFGFRNSIFFTCGSCISDIFYLILVFFGVSNFIASNVFLRICLGFSCGIILIALGGMTIVSINKGDVAPTSVAFQKKRLVTFLSGIMVTLTNPMTIIGWIAIAGNFLLIWKKKYPAADRHIFLTILFIMTGVLIWFVPLTFTVSKLRKVLSKKIEAVFVYVSNSILIVFGIIALYNCIIDINSALRHIG